MEKDRLTWSFQEWTSLAPKSTFAHKSRSVQLQSSVADCWAIEAVGVRMPCWKGCSDSHLSVMFTHFNITGHSSGSSSYIPVWIKAPIFYMLFYLLKCRLFSPSWISIIQLCKEKSQLTIAHQGFKQNNNSILCLFLRFGWEILTSAELNNLKYIWFISCHWFIWLSIIVTVGLFQSANFVHFHPGQSKLRS